MEFYYYYMENEESNTIKKDKVFIDEKKLRSLWYEIFNKYSVSRHYEYTSITLPSFMNNTLQNKNIEINETMFFDKFMINNFKSELTGLKKVINTGGNCKEYDKIYITYDECSIPYLCRLIDKLLSLKGKNYNQIISELNNGTIEKKQEEIMILENKLKNVFQEMIETEDDNDIAFNSKYEEIKGIEKEITELRSFDKQYEEYYREVLNSIHHTYVDNIQTILIDRVKSFLELDSTHVTEFKDNKVKNLSKIPNKKD